MDEKGQESVRNKKKSVMLALEKRHKIENSQNRAIALTLFGICLTQKTKKKFLKLQDASSISSTREEGKEEKN